MEREKALPQSIEAEQAVLGSLLIDPDAIALVEGYLEPRDFYREAHRQIYQAITDLTARRDPADFITLCDELEKRGELQSVGGHTYITGLINAPATSGNVEHYGRIVRSHGVERRLIHAAAQIVALASASDPDALSRAEELILTISKQSTLSDFEPAGQVMTDVFATLERLHDHRGEIIGVPTGFYTLDRVLGGLQKSDLCIFAGRPATGKTSLAMNIAYNAATKYGEKVGVFSLEMSRKQLVQRLLSMDAGIDQQRLRTGWIEDEEWERIISAGDRISGAGIWIDDTGALPMHACRSRARRLHSEHGIDFFIVDYLQLMQAYSNGRRVEPRLMELQEISGGLKSLAKELDIPILALAQLSRAVDQRQSKIPQLSDLRESGSIENDADVVTFIYREEMYNPEATKGQADLIIAKHRNGPTGECSLYFDAPHTRFFNDRQEAVLAYAE